MSMYIVCVCMDGEAGIKIGQIDRQQMDRQTDGHGQFDRYTCTNLHSSRLRDRTLDMCEPSFLCTPEHSMQSRQPWFTEPHSGSEDHMILFETQYTTYLTDYHTVHRIVIYSKLQLPPTHLVSCSRHKRCFPPSCRSPVSPSPWMNSEGSTPHHTRS